MRIQLIGMKATENICSCFCFFLASLTSKHDSALHPYIFEAKIYIKKWIRYELIEVEGRLLGEQRERETTGSSRAPGKRPRNGNQFSISKNQQTGLFVGQFNVY